MTRASFIEGGAGKVAGGGSINHPPPLNALLDLWISYTVTLSRTSRSSCRRVFATCINTHGEVLCLLYEVETFWFVARYSHKERLTIILSDIDLERDFFGGLLSFGNEVTRERKIGLIDLLHHLGRPMRSCSNHSSGHLLYSLGFFYGCLLL